MNGGALTDERIEEWLTEGDQYFADRFPDPSIRERMAFFSHQVGNLSLMVERQQIDIEQFRRYTLRLIERETQPPEIPAAFMRDAGVNAPGVEQIHD